MQPSLIEDLRRVLTLALSRETDKTQRLEALAQLDAYARAPDSELSRDLLHYLRQRSYEKALHYLDFIES